MCIASQLSGVAEATKPLGQYEWYWSSLLTGNALGGGQLEGLLLLSLETSGTVFGAESPSLGDEQLCLRLPGPSRASTMMTWRGLRSLRLLGFHWCDKTP